ncbi:MAG TPA: hypothetical protein VFH61_03530, partial [Thermoleophilia bacterium]|nr:hypothetical protein [Thermoleophilia bacterium]
FPSEGEISFSGNPSALGAYQQRLLLAGTNEEPDVVNASQVALPHNFRINSPIVDSDSLSWRQVGRRLNRVRHFAEAAGRLWQFSDVGESMIQGAEDGVLRPGEVNPRQLSENGAANRPAPLVVHESALYVQARGGLVRDIAPVESSGFAGSDLTLMSAHLLDGYTILDWCYQQTPDPIIWIVRSDGALLSLTYVRELGIIGWARHDTDGTVESVACVPEGNRDVVYWSVLRAGGRYIERMTDRLSSDWLLRAHTDSTVTTQGSVTIEDPAETPENSVGNTPNGASINTATTPDRLEETTGLSAHELVFGTVGFTTLQSRVEFAAYVEADERSIVEVAANVCGVAAGVELDLATGLGTLQGNFAQVQVDYTMTPNGAGFDLTVDFSLVRNAVNDALFAPLLISNPNAYTYATPSETSGDDGFYTGTAGFGCYFESSVNRAVVVEPARLAGVAHLNGLFVSILADDGVVLASPSGTPSVARIVAAGFVELTTAEYNAYGDYLVGLPFTTDIQTLEIDTAQGKSIRDGRFVMTRLGLFVENTGSLFAGQNAIADPSALSAGTYDLQPLPIEDTEGNAVTGVITGYREVNIEGSYNPGTGGIFLRNVDPQPLTVLAIIPQGHFPRK